MHNERCTSGSGRGAEKPPAVKAARRSPPTLHSKHYEISVEALTWQGERAAILLELVKQVCRDHLEALQKRSGVDS